MFNDKERQIVAKMRSSFRDMNKGHISERVKKGKPVESWMIEVMNKKGAPIDDEKSYNWLKCPPDEDKRLKRDAFTFFKDKNEFSALKFRLSGDDILVDMIDPLVCTREQLRWLTPEETPWGRDYQFDGKLYVVLAGNAWDTLYIVDYPLVIKPISSGAYREWLDDPDGFDLYPGIGYKSKLYPGCELRCVRDAGYGYRGGSNKLICFIKPESVPHTAYGMELPSPELLKVFGINKEF